MSKGFDGIFQKLSLSTTKTPKWLVRQINTPTSLGIHTIWSSSSLSAWRSIGSLVTYRAQNEDSDQTGRTSRLIWVFAGRSGQLFVFSCCSSNDIQPLQLTHPCHLSWVSFWHCTASGSGRGFEKCCNHRLNETECATFLNLSCFQKFNVFTETHNQLALTLFIPRHTKSGGVLCYTLRKFWVSVRLSVCPSVHQRFVSGL